MIAYVPDEKIFYTPDEPWTIDLVKGSWYEAAAQFASDHLDMKAGRKCLAIGSPLGEALMLQRGGWDVTHLDIRKQPDVGVKCVVGDITNIPFDNQSFNAISSTCVLCHAGLGRYGDPIVSDGDRKALIEIERVMSPGATATIMFGPTIPGLLRTLIMRQTHRIYMLSELPLMVEEAGLVPMLSCYWHEVGQQW